jgi:hypothetical protein
LIQDAQLQFRVDIGQEEVTTMLIGCRDPGPKIFEDIEVGLVGDGLVEVMGVLPLPTKGFPLSLLQACEVDPSFLKEGEMSFWKVHADGADEVHLAEKAGGH